MPKRTKKRQATGAGARASKRTALEEEAYDSDAEPPPIETAKDHLNWRLSPEESLSDWTLEVTANGNLPKTYHVHKQNLAVGPRKSEYFVRLFREGGRFSESQVGKSRLDFDELAAKWIPELLDYLYTPEDSIKITTKNATALHSLAKYFDMRRLRWEVKQFWQNDLDAESCGTYYEHASILKDEKILSAALKACAENIMSITKESRLVHVPEPELWIGMLKDKPVDVGVEDFSSHMSKMIAAFAQNNIEILESDMFQQMTSAKLLPHVHVEAAIPLIDTERQIVDPGDISRLSNLQKRCVASLSNGWESIDLKAKGSLLALAKKQHPVVLAEIMAGTLSAAKTTLENKAKELSGFRRVTQNPGLYHRSVDVAFLPESRRGRQEEQVGCNIHFPADDFRPLYYYYC